MMDTWTKVPFTGVSMNPSFAGVESVWVDFKKKNQPQVGDILLFRDKNAEWICHRFIFSDKNQLWVMGDLSTNVEVVSYQAIWGIARAVGNNEATRLLKKTLFTNWICYFQYQQVCSSFYILKKVYRFLSKVFLYFEKWLSNRDLSHKKS